MPVSIAKAQAQVGDRAFEGLGEEKGGASFPIAIEVLGQYGAEFLRVMGEYVDKLNVVSSGDLTKKAKLEINDDGSGFKIILPEYFDYPNEGVRGVKSSSNAPSSPYKYKSYGMGTEGRKKIRELVVSGKMKIRTPQRANDKALGIGLERKRLNVVDAKTETLIYLIKRQGIKATHYFDLTIADVFKDFDKTMGEAIGQDIVYNITKMNFKKNGSNN